MMSAFQELKRYVTVINHFHHSESAANDQKNAIWSVTEHGR
jgi:hypothetical protein